LFGGKIVRLDHRFFRRVDEPRRRNAALGRPGGKTGDPAELSFHRRGPPRVPAPWRDPGRQRHPHRPPGAPEPGTAPATTRGRRGRWGGQRGALLRPNYLPTEEARRVAAQSIRVARGLAKAPALARFRPIERLPGPGVPDDDEVALAKAAGDIGTTIFHPVGTAKMGRDTDPLAVVDDRLRGFGMARLPV